MLSALDDSKVGGEPLRQVFEEWGRYTKNDVIEFYSGHLGVVHGWSDVECRVW
jgi:hypothetical protein